MIFFLLHAVCGPPWRFIAINEKFEATEEFHEQIMVCLRLGRWTRFWDM